MTECLQQRPYAIMTRAKHRAGIPVTEPSKPVTKKTTKKNTLQKLMEKNDSCSRWRTTGYLNKEHEKRAELQTRLDNLKFRKPAGKMRSHSYLPY